MVIINDNQFSVSNDPNLEFESLPSVVLQGNIQSAGSDNLYQLNLEKNTTLILDVDFLAGDTLTDSVVYLLDADMNVVTSNDDYSVENDSTIKDSYLEYAVERSDIYYVKVTGFGDDVGTYTLNVSKSIIANNDEATTQENTAVTLNPLDNDVGNDLSINTISANNGSVVVWSLHHCLQL